MQTVIPTHTRRKPPHELLVSVVMPVFNEAPVLPVLLDRVHSALRACGTHYEVVFVNDGSDDESPQILDGLASSDPQVRVLHLSRNFGHQAAVQAGLSAARGDAIVLMDADLQDAPDAIGRFLAEWYAGYDVVYAIRTDRKEAAYKRLLFSGFHWLLNAIAHSPIPRDAGNFGLVDRRVADEITRLAERDRYFPGLRSWVGFRQRGIEVERLARYDDRPRVSLRGLWRLAKTAIYSFSTVPLAVFSFTGYLALTVFLAVSGFSLYCKLFTSLAIPGWTSYVLSATFFGALNALGISILGEYVVRIYDQVRGRPIYLVERVVEGARKDHRHTLPRAAMAEGSARTADDPAYAALLRQAIDLLDEARQRAEQPTVAIEWPAGVETSTLREQ
jgi:polyisoprenyl-phosphate glycosyltransferase